MKSHLAPVSLLACLFACATASAQTWNGSDSNLWSNPANWTPNAVPNSTSADAIINSTANNPVQMDQSFTVGQLYLTATTSLDLLSNNLYVAGGILSNYGSISTEDGILQVESTNLTLSGPGTFTLSSGAWINQATSGLSLTNSGNTIQGSGQIGQNGLSVNNASGAINANQSGATLYLDGGGNVTNSATLEATNGGYLQVNTNVNNAGGLIKADTGGTVNLAADVTGGTLTTTGGGIIQASGGTPTLNGVTISSGSTYTDAGKTLLQNTITNQGNIAVPNGTLQVNGGDVTLMGGGSVTMSSDAYLNQSTSGLTLHNVDNTIQGTGELGQNGLALDNQAGGTVNANVGSGTLYMDGGGLITNAGLLEATNGGVLQISNTVNNSSGNITANGGTVSLASQINGGTLNSLGGGTLQEAGGNATLNGVTLSAGSTFTVQGTTYLQGTLTNYGNFAVPNTILQVNGGDLTLTGGGSITMASDSYFNQSTSGLTLHNVDNVIQGTGELGQNGLSLDNQSGGTVDANVLGGTLYLDGGGVVTNLGALEATAHGTLEIDNTVFNSSSITANGGTVNVNARINGGTLVTTGGGAMNNIGGAVLNGVTLSSGSTFNVGGSTTHFEGTFTNNGTVTVPNGNFTVQGGDLTLTGGGTVTLSADAYVNQATSGLTLHNVNNTIQGTGHVGQNGLTLDNQVGGTVDANVSGGVLNLDGGATVTNAGVIEATQGGILNIYNNVDNAATATTITANAGTVNFSAQINGGTLSTTNGGAMNNLGGTVLNGVTLANGTTFNVGGSTTYLEGSIVNHGTFVLPNGNLTIAGGDVTLSGGGTVSMSANAFFNQATSGLTLHNVDNTIQGTGHVGQNGMGLDNQAGGTVNANVSGGQLNLDGGGLVTNAGLIEATGGGILYVTDTVNNSATITANAGTVNFSAQINGGTLSTTNGGTMNNLGGTVLNGVTLASGTSFNVGGSSTYLEGTVTNQGTITIPDGNLTILGNVTLAGSGTVLMQQDAFFNQGTSGLTLHNVGNTIEGTGHLGQNGMTLDNQSGGTLLANSSAGVFNIDGGGALTNAGTIHVMAGAEMNIVQTLNQTGGLTLVDAGGTLDASTINVGGGTLEVNGTLDPASIDIFPGATLEGLGTVVGDVTNDGTTILGDSGADAGKLTIEGNFGQNADGTLVEGLDSLTQDGLLDVTGQVTFDGTLDIDIDGIHLQTGEVFELVDGYSSETMGAITFDPNSGAASDWSLVVNDLGQDQIDLVYSGPSYVPPQQGVPEPSAWLDIAFLAALAFGAPLLRRKPARLEF